jgi:ABC-2 type transport system ATP-binding protein
MSEQVAISLKGITKKIGKKKITDNMTFEVKAGEVFGLLGPNGAGKTTIMRMITALIKPTEGEIFIDGLALSQNHENALSKIGAIIESPDLYRHLSGKLNLKIMANMLNNVNEKRIDEVTKYVGLEDRIKDKVSKYSLGMRQRLGIAIALLGNPKVLVLDEPLNGLDPDGVKEVRETLIKLAHEQGVCIIVSSHILSEMELICDRFAIIDNGKLIETKLLTETNSDEEMSYQFNLLNATGIEQLKTDLLSLSIPAENVLDVSFTIFGTRLAIAESLRKLIENGFDVVSVEPKKKSLEDYFIKRVGEIEK